MGADEVVEAARDGDLGEEMWEQVEVMEGQLEICCGRCTESQEKLTVLKRVRLK